jgi:hypothetical protein
MVSGNCAPGPHHSHRQHATAMDREGYALGGPLQAGLAESVHGSCAAARPRGEEGAMRDTQRPFASGAARKAARTRRGGLGDEAGMARPHLRAWVRGDKHLVDRLPSSLPNHRRPRQRSVKQCPNTDSTATTVRKSTLGMLVVKLMEL